ncbi:MAG TPA: hypothetical protein VFX76_10085 [Roseiflexaceae bacterium]|nr:hypothetical protein [Roseiflexaceae bacterium]
MRRVSIAVIGGLCVLLCGLGAVVRGAHSHDGVPPTASAVRIDHYGLSHTHVNYVAPADWNLLEIFAYLSEHGWERDRAAERALQRSWHPDINRTFAIFVRQSLFGLMPERATISVTSDRHVRIRLLRCLRYDPWLACP